MKKGHHNFCTNLEIPTIVKYFRQKNSRRTFSIWPNRIIRVPILERNHFISVSLDGGIIVYLVFFLNQKKERKENSLHYWTSMMSQHRKPHPLMKNLTGKILFSLQGSQLMQTGFSLWEKVHRENPVFNTGMGLQCRQKFRNMNRAK